MYVSPSREVRVPFLPEAKVRGNGVEKMVERVLPPGRCLRASWWAAWDLGLRVL